MSGIVELAFRESVVIIDRERFRHQRIVVVIKKNKLVLIAAISGFKFRICRDNKKLKSSIVLFRYFFACLNTL